MVPQGLRVKAVLVSDGRDAFILLDKVITCHSGSPPPELYYRFPPLFEGGILSIPTPGATTMRAEPCRGVMFIYRRANAAELHPPSCRGGSSTPMNRSRSGLQLNNRWNWHYW